MSSKSEKEGEAEMETEHFNSNRKLLAKFNLYGNDMQKITSIYSSKKNKKNSCLKTHLRIN